MLRCAQSWNRNRWQRLSRGSPREDFPTLLPIIWGGPEFESRGTNPTLIVGLQLRCQHFPMNSSFSPAGLPLHNGNKPLPLGTVTLLPSKRCLPPPQALHILTSRLQQGNMCTSANHCIVENEAEVKSESIMMTTTYFIRMVQWQDGGFLSNKICSPSCNLASVAPKVRVIQYPMNCHPKLIKVVLCSSRLRHDAWTTSASSALSLGFCWNSLSSLS